MKNRSQRYDINKTMSIHGHKYTKYKVCLSIMMGICIKQDLGNIWSSIHEKLSNTEVELKKSVTYKKAYICLKINLNCFTHCKWSFETMNFIAGRDHLQAKE